MKSFIVISASLATIAAFGFVSYTTGASSESSNPQAIEVTINNAISGLPQSKQESAKNLLSPILDLVSSQTNSSAASDGSDVKVYSDRLKDKLEQFSLASYQADVSPFIPPKKKTQFFCDNTFRFAYKSISNNLEYFDFILEGVRRSIAIGEPFSYKLNDKKIDLLYLSYSKLQKGPILQYTCSNI